MSQFKVLVTDYEYETLEPEEEVLSDIGAKLLKAQCETEDEIIEKAPEDVRGLISQYAPVGEKVFERLQDLQVVARYGIGVDTIDVKAATDHGVYVVNVAQYCQNEVADHVLALLLALARKIVLLNKSVKGGEWNLNVAKPINRLVGKKLGCIGFGSIAKTLAPKAKAFGFEVMVYDPYVEEEVISNYPVRIVGFDDLLSLSDFISIHTPLNEKTKQLISVSELKSMKESSILINTARGGVIDEEALIDALREGEISGAGLDVTSREPIDPGSPLLDMENVIITPHVGWYSEESKIELKTEAAQGVADVLANTKPKYLVNEEIWDR